jgi:prophage maintenance system killer protein
VDHLTEVVWNVPLAVAEDHCAIDANKREAARKIIGRTR